MKNFLKSLGAAILIVWIYKGAYRGFQKAFGFEIEVDDNIDIHASLIMLGSFASLILAGSSMNDGLIYFTLGLNLLFIFVGILLYFFMSE